MDKKIVDEGKPFSESAFGKIFIGIGVVIGLFIIYAVWVNSGAHSGTFFGMTFRWPLESKEHYCGRKSEGILTLDMSAYKKCMMEE